MAFFCRHSRRRVRDSLNKEQQTDLGEAEIKRYCHQNDTTPAL
jgi:hypothetical protein